MSTSPKEAMRMVRELRDACQEQLTQMKGKDNSVKTFTSNAYIRVNGKKMAYSKCLEIMEEVEYKIK